MKHHIQGYNFLLRKLMEETKQSYTFYTSQKFGFFSFNTSFGHYCAKNVIAKQMFKELIKNFKFNKLPHYDLNCPNRSQTGENFSDPLLYQ